MDDRRFDEISKQLSTGLSRKGILRVLGGLGAAGVAAAGSLLPSEAKQKRKNKNKKNDNDTENRAKAQRAQAEGKKGKGKKGKGKKGKGKNNNVQQKGTESSEPATLVADLVSTCPSPSSQNLVGGNVNSCPGGAPGFEVPGNTQGCKTFTSGPGGCCKLEVCVTNGKLSARQVAGSPSCSFSSILVKGGPDHIVYNFNPAATCADNLAPPANCGGGNQCGFSHAFVCGTSCCKPKTCPDVPGKCGSIDNGCGGTITCNCGPGKKCCEGTCIDNSKCCGSDQCDKLTCRNATCNNGTCNYTPVGDGQQGPNCTGQGETCCDGKDCCKAGEVCTGTGCCKPLTCDFPDYKGKCGSFPNGCGGTIECGCGNGNCCDGTCVAGDQCCASNNCEPKLCKRATCDDGTCDYDAVDDDEPGPLCDGKDEFCCGGDECCTAPEVCWDKGCCTPKTCEADYPGQCGTFKQGCGLPDLVCTCPSGGCCEGVCQGDDECCGSGDCKAELCQTASCDDGSCDYTPVENGSTGPLCDGEDEFCCNGNECCVDGEICTGQEGCCTPKTCAADYAGQCGTFPQGCGLPELTCGCAAGQECLAGTCVEIPGCTPVSQAEACAGLSCGPASNGCGVDYDCGLCSTKKKKGQRPIKQTCVTGVCKPFKKKRCIGKGLAGQPCGSKCKCANGRKCNNGRCCEGVGDGSVHCTANSDCCPGLMCAYRRPGQHRVCIPKNAKDLGTESTGSTATPGIALGAILTGVAATLGAKLTGNGEAASVAMDEVQIHALTPRN